MKQEKSGLFIISVLTVVCLLSTAVLAAVYRGTEGKIAENIKKKTEAAVYEVLEGLTGYEQVSGSPLVYRGITAAGPAGYAVLAEGMGFQGTIKIMVGIAADKANLTGIKILDSSETPGLGDKIRHDPFTSQFRGLPVPAEGSEPAIDTITGATISSKAVKKIVGRAIEDAKRIP